MKDFRNTTKTLSGHSFPASHGFSHSTGGTINRFYGGGSIGGTRDKVDTNAGHPQTNPPAGNRVQGNAATQRKVPSTQELADFGGKNPLTAGFARGGKTGAKKHFHVHKHYHAKGGRTRSVSRAYSAQEKRAETFAEGGHVHDDTSIPAGYPDYKAGGKTKRSSTVRKSAGGALYATGGTINKLAGGGAPAMPTGVLGRMAMAPRVPLRRPMTMPGGPRAPLVTRSRGGRT